MAKKSILRVVFYDDGSYELSRGSDCDGKVVKGKVAKKKKRKKGTS